MAVEVKAFNRWSTTGIKVTDPGLINYITVKPTFVPSTGARYAGSRFHKSRTFIVERLMNKLMVAGHKGKKHHRSSGHNTGKAQTVYALMEECLEMIEQKTNENPIKVVVQAVENAAPREEVTTIEYGGARYPKAVECAPQRRVDIALRHMTQGASAKAFKNKRSLSSTLADEIVNAFKKSNQSNAITKKMEVERQADSSR